MRPLLENAASVQHYHETSLGKCQQLVREQHDRALLFVDRFYGQCPREEVWHRIEHHPEHHHSGQANRLSHRPGLSALTERSISVPVSTGSDHHPFPQ